MDIFISWSGPRSEAVARALHGWLPKIVNAFKPWLSSSDIDKGARWSTDVAVRLQAAKAGIICVTPSNVHSDWILFEAGALSKTLQNTFVCPLLIGLEPADVKGPLAQFQATRTTRDDVLRLLKTLNTGLGETALPDAHIEEAFDVWWPKLEAELKKLPAEDSTSRPHRPERDLLEEILDLVRNQSRSSAGARLIHGESGPMQRQRELAFSVMHAAMEIDPSIDLTEHLPVPVPNIKYRLGSSNDPRGRKWVVSVPADVATEDVDAIVKSQIVSDPAESEAGLGMTKVQTKVQRGRKKP